MPFPRLRLLASAPTGAGRRRPFWRRWCLGGLLAPVLALAGETEDLAGLSLQQLMGVPVVAASKYLQSQADVAAAVSVITRDEIRAHGWTTLGEALASLPGFYVSDDRLYTYVGTRGLGLPDDYSARLLITLNGLRLNEPVYDSMPAGHELPVDLDLIERIEVIPGPGGAVYGQNALFGVVNLVTREGGDIGGVELAAEWRWPQRSQHVRASLGRRLDNGVDLLLSASDLRSRGEDRYYDYGVAGAGVASGLDGERDAELFLRLSRRGWSFDLSHGDRRKDDPTASYYSDPLVPGNFIRDRYLQAQLQYETRLADGTQQLMARLSAGEYRYGNGAVYGGERYWFTGAGASRGLEVRWLSTAHADHTFMLGAEWQSLPRQDQTAHYLPDPSYDLYYLTRGWRAGVFAQDEWRLSDRMSATLGLRADSNSTNGTRMSPRAALIWKPDDASSYKLLYGRAYRSPNVYERNWTDGDTYPTPLPANNAERIDTLELVTDRRLSPQLSMRASLYRWSLRDRVVWDDSGPSWQTISGLPVRASGLELSAEHRSATGVRLRGSLSLQDARSSGQRLVNSPRWMFKLLARAPVAGGWQAALETLAEGARLGEDGQFYRGPQRVNLHLSNSTLWPGVTVSAGVRNLFDRQDRQPVSGDNWVPFLERNGRSLSLKLEAGF